MPVVAKLAPVALVQRELHVALPCSGPGMAASARRAWPALGQTRRDRSWMRSALARQIELLASPSARPSSSCTRRPVAHDLACAAPAARTGSAQELEPQPRDRQLRARLQPLERAVRSAPPARRRAAPAGPTARARARSASNRPSAVGMKMLSLIVASSVGSPATNFGELVRVAQRRRRDRSTPAPVAARPAGGRTRGCAPGRA